VPADKAPGRSRRPDRRHLAVLIGLGALVALAFSNSFHSGFVLDNRGLLLDPRVREATRENLSLIFAHTYWWPTGEAGLYRPFTTLSYLFNFALLGNGVQAAGYHWTNLLLHIANVWLAYALAVRLMDRLWAAVFTAALWAIHPALTESVTNIVGRADLLASIAVLSGLLMYGKSTQVRGARQAIWLLGLAGVTAIGVFSKESAVAILPVIVLCELVWWKKEASRRALAFGCLATLPPILAMVFQRAAVLAASAPAELPFTDNPIVGAGWWTGHVTAVKVMARYLAVAFLPAKLSCDYSYNQIPLARGTAADWLSCGAVLAAGAIVVLLYRANRTCFFLACFAFLTFLPASNLLFPIGTIMADRLLYLPALGLLGCMVTALYAAGARSSKLAFLPPVLLCLVGCGFGVKTWMRNQDWQSELTLASADVRVSPDSFKLHRLLAASMFDADPSHTNIDQVIGEIGKSVAILAPLPDALSRPDVYRMAGYYYLVKSRMPGQVGKAALYRQAIDSLLHGIAIDKVQRLSYGSHANSTATSGGDAQAHLLLSVAYLESGNPGEALSAANRARVLDPLDPRIYRQLSAVFFDQGLQAESQTAAAMEDAITALQQSKWLDAADLSGRVLTAGASAYPAAYEVNAMANLHLGNPDAAEKSIRAAIQLDSAHVNPRTNYVLGLILAAKHQFRPAADLLNTYLKAAPNAPDAETVRKQLLEIQRQAQLTAVR
jgi:hypothetical protein